MDKDQAKVPVLLFLLQHNKSSQIIRAILNSKVSASLLQEYGHQIHKFSQIEEFRISRSVHRFNILQLIELKGSNTHSVKECENIVLQEMIRRKLQGENISKETRKALWLQFTQYYTKPHFYCDLKKLQIAQDFIRTIEKDIIRTFSGQKVRCDAREVLQLFSHYNPYLGYCQGMNTIIAFLVKQGFTCQQSFFIFKKVSQQILPCDYYSNMGNMMVYTRIFYEMLAITHPQVYNHMKKICTEMQRTYAMMVSFVLQWFVCLFCNQNVNQQISQVIWDHFLIDGITVLFKAALGYIDIMKPFILKCTEFCKLFVTQNLTTKCKNKKQNTSQIQPQSKSESWKLASPFNSYSSQNKNQCVQNIKILRTKLRNPLIDKETISIIQERLPSQTECMFFQAIEDNLNQNKSYDYFVFKPNYQLNIIPNYIQNINRQYFSNEKQKNQVDKLIVGRIAHVCRFSDTLTEDSASDKNLGEQCMEKTPKKSIQSTPKQVKSASKETKKKIRDKVCEKIAEMANNKGINRSQSVIFMEEMVMNSSISNLLELYDIDQLFQ